LNCAPGSSNPPPVKKASLAKGRVYVRGLRATQGAMSDDLWWGKVKARVPQRSPGIAT
jgi:hypothetical protein